METPTIKKFVLRFTVCCVTSLMPFPRDEDSFNGENSFDPEISFNDNISLNQALGEKGLKIAHLNINGFNNWLYTIHLSITHPTCTTYLHIIGLYDRSRSLARLFEE